MELEKQLLESDLENGEILNLKTFSEQSVSNFESNSRSKNNQLPKPLIKKDESDDPDSSDEEGNISLPLCGKIVRYISQFCVTFSIKTLEYIADPVSKNSKNILDFLKGFVVQAL